MVINTLLRLFPLVLVVLAVAACAPTTADQPTVAPADGSIPVPTHTPAPLTAEQRGQVVFFQWSCISCHTITGVGGRIGPDLKGIAGWVAQNHPDADVEDYLRAGVVDVLAVVNPPWRGDLMPQDYGQKLTPKEVDDLVAYLMSLE
ncbi:MAG: cytochrome c [Anaerolineae bacterium]|nr:cytochrome c [Anaerolineae bacterium]